MLSDRCTAAQVSTNYIVILQYFIILIEYFTFVPSKFIIQSMGYDFVASSLQILAYFSWCNLVHLLLSVYSDKYFPNFHILQQKDKDGWYNRGTSISHAITQFSIVAYYWFRVNPNREISPSMSQYEGLAFDTMVGYILYDTLNELETNREADTLIHHAMGFVSHMLCRVYDNGVGAHFTMMVFLAEFSTPFLHTCWLMDVLRLTKHTLFFVSAALLVVCFFVSRVLLAPYAAYSCISSYTNNEVTRAYWTLNGAPVANFYLNAVIISLFTVLNYYWFYCIIKVAKKELSK